MTTTPERDVSAPGGAFSVPSFRALWGNAVTFFMVMNAMRFLYGWVVLDGLERGESWQGAVVFLLGVPSFFLLMPAGVWADRLDPKRLLIVTQVALAVVLIVTAVGIGSGSGSLGLIVISALLAGSVTAIGGPVRQSLIPLVLDKQQLLGGIALNALAVTLSFVLGPVVVQGFGNWFGFDGAFWTLAALTVIGTIVLVGLRSPGAAMKGDVTTMRQAMRVGVAFVWNDRGIRTMFLLLGVAGLVMSPIMFVTVQAHVKEELGRSADDAAAVIAMMGIGIAISSVIVMRRGNMPNKAVIFMRSMVCGTATLVLMGRTTEYWQLLVLGVVIGMCGGFFINMNQSLIQGNTPAEVMGRVMSVYALAQIGLTPIGALLLGFLGAAIGTGNAMSLAAAAGLTVVLLVYVRANSIRQLS